MTKTLTKILNAYDDLIKDPEKHLIKWRYYPAGCPMCDLFTSCCDCPIQLTEFGKHPCMDETYYNLKSTIQGGAFNALHKAAIARRNAIIKAIEKAGYEYA